MKITTNVDYLHKECKALSYEDSLKIKKKINLFLLGHKPTANNTLGLACNQLGLDGRVIMYRSDTNKPFKFLINPIILEKSEDTIITKENCLSVPDNNKGRVYESRRNISTSIISNTNNNTNKGDFL